jgi:hypothetical protein
MSGMIERNKCQTPWPHDTPATQRPVGRTLVRVVLQRLDLVDTIRLVNQRGDLVELARLLLLADAQDVLQTLQRDDHHLGVLDLQQVAQRFDASCTAQ